MLKPGPAELHWPPSVCRPDAESRRWHFPGIFDGHVSRIQVGGAMQKPVCLFNSLVFSKRLLLKKQSAADSSGMWSLEGCNEAFLEFGLQLGGGRTCYNRIIMC